MVGEWPFQCPLGPLAVSSTSSGPKLNSLEMQIAPGKPEILKSKVSIFKVVLSQ